METTFNETAFAALTDGLTFEAKLTGDDFDPHTKDGLMGQSHWKVTLKRGKHSFATEYHQGAAHRVYRRKHGSLAGYGGLTDKPVKLPYGGRMTTDEQMDLEHSVPTTPTLKDVLYSLYSDASGVDQPFEDWASDYGYDSDSRKAEASYNACREEMFALRKLGLDMEKLAELY